MSKNYHRDVIEVISVESTDWRALVFSIAKTNPKAVLNAAVDLNWRDEVLEEYRIYGKVPAIKLCRSLTGMGLKESKSTVEEITKSKHE